MDLLIATRSAGKTREIRALVAGSPFTPVFPEDLGLERRAEEADLEIGATYAAHAIAKARYFAGRSDLPTAADDSGIEVDALGGAPGVASARWAGERGRGTGEDSVESANNALLVERLRGVPPERRTARYRCVVAFVGAAEADPVVVEGVCEGWGNKRTLVSFDLSDHEDQQVSSATLRLFITYNGGNWGKHNDRLIEVHKLLSDWTEGNGANFIPKNLDEDDEPAKNRGVGSGVTWACNADSNISNKKSDCNRKWNGGNFAGGISDSTVITSSTLNQWVEFDVTGDVNSFLNGNAADKYGWLIKKSNEYNSGRIAFASSENANSAIRPQLVLEFN